MSASTFFTRDDRGRFLRTAVAHSRAFIDFSTDVRPPGRTPQA